MKDRRQHRVAVKYEGDALMAAIDELLVAASVSTPSTAAAPTR